MFSHRPVLGWGLGTFPTVYPSYRSFYTNLFVNEAHNDYAQLLVETGLLGFGLMLWFLICFVPAWTADLSPLGIQMGWGGVSRGFARMYRNSASIASWISICRFRRMLRCFMCFAPWQPPNSHPSRRDPGGPEPHETEEIGELSRGTS